MYVKYYSNFHSILHLNKFVTCFEEFYFIFDWHISVILTGKLSLECNHPYDYILFPTFFL